MNGEIDVRHALSAVGVPTLIVHRHGDQSLPVEGSRYMADRIRGAKLVELPGDDHLVWLGDQDEILDEVEGFLTGVRRGADPDRVLATVLFTDVVRSTEHAVELGDKRWSDLLASHHRAVRHELTHWRGTEIDTTGDGFLATFDGPARAIRCACAARDAVHELGLEIRAGLHTGEYEIFGATIAGLTVHTGARIAALAGTGEVLVSSAVKDLVAGSGIEFEDRGEHELKGVPDRWRLYRALG
jgi:class 3 adenylate cyclase